MASALIKVLTEKQQNNNNKKFKHSKILNYVSDLHNLAFFII